MQPYPHLYQARVVGDESGMNHSTSQNLPMLTVAGPAEFDGPGDQWSPETLICATAANCLVLTFRAVARASSFTWLQLVCDVQGTLDRSDGVARFTHFALRARLILPRGTDMERAKRLMDKAEKACIIVNSLNGTHSLDVEIVERE